MAKRYVNFAAGWVKQGPKGEYISGLAGGERSKTKLLLQLEDGTTIPITNFAGFFNEKKKTEKAPDLSFTMTVEE